MLSAELYRLLAERFADDAEARALFERLEQEELQHANRVRLLAARYRHDPRLLGGEVIEPAELDALLVDAEEAVRAARQGELARTVEEARVNLAALEERFAHAHAELIAAAGHPALRAFFVQLAEQDRAHRALLGRPAGRTRR